MNITFSVMHRPVMLSFVVGRRRDQQAVGYTNRCNDGTYIVTLDYDGHEYSWIPPELRRLQDHFYLGDFHTYQSSPGKYHAVCLDKVTLQELLLIYGQASCDPDYLTVPTRFGQRCWVLRLSAKDGAIPTYIETVPHQRTRTASYAHAAMLHKLGLIPLMPTTHDGDPTLIVARYTT